jgi:hypothetical protein
VCERIYFDSLSLLKQLIGGLDLKRPGNWLLAARCVQGLLKMTGSDPDPGLVYTTPPDLET